MLNFEATRDDGEIFIFSALEGSDYLSSATIEGSYELAESPWTIPAGLHIFPQRLSASESFFNMLSEYCNVYSESQIAGHTFTFNNGSSIEFALSNLQPTYKVGDLSVTKQGSGYMSLPYWDDRLVELAGSIKQPYSHVEFNWYANKPDQPRVYAMSTLNIIPEIVSGYGNLTHTFLNEFYAGMEPTVDNEDPYANGGESGTGGGDGTFDWGGDSVGVPDLPTISASDAGFITLFNPSLSQLKSLASYMWSDLFDVEGWQKIFADPMDAILGLSIVPVAVPDGGTSVVKVGNISTSVTMTKAAQQYISVDCGTITIAKQYNSYLDYEPFSKAEIYLPFIGMHALSVDDVMGKAVHVVYHVDILSGACVAYVEIDGSVHYTFIGQCSSSIPITGNDWTNVINGVLNIAGSIGSMVATGGASAPLALGSIASTAVNSMKPTVEKSGSLSGTGGLMANKKPYIILTRPRQCVPKNQNKFLGYPSFINEDLGKLSGYTEVESVRLTGAYGTEQEMEEIYSLLKSGVIF